MRSARLYQGPTIWEQLTASVPRRRQRDHAAGVVSGVFQYVPSYCIQLPGSHWLQVAGGRS